MGLEIILAIIGILLIIGMAGGAMLLALVVLPWLKEFLTDKRYPIQIPGWKTRISNLPHFLNNLEDIGRALDLILNRAMDVKKYNKKDVLNKINNLRIDFIRPQNATGERYIVDEYGRKIAGDNRGNIIRVVALDDDTLSTIAFFHEIGHDLHEIENMTDYNHSDDKMWKDIVVWCRKNFK